MELDEFKSGWRNAGNRIKSQEDLEKMTKLVNHPVIKRIKTRLAIQIVVLLLFLLVYYDWFDGDQKPLYANLALVTGLVLYVLNDVVGYLSLMKPVGESNLRQSVLDYLMRVKRLSFFSLLVTLLYSSSIVIFFTSTIVFTKEKWLVLLFSTVIVCQLIILSSKLWSRWIKKLNQQIKDFDVDDNRTA
ncbi:hypothetical protein U0035_13180 [Niabella yanshanensis]|uniref:Uncharacterized protein n=1 Tax=Niabella yanshanensis TaxID=577386 RepID=A0ABZ0W024_9BACT|nr:hypothetical protein [Niabella yanshanensis]WQD36620.1 hypothetical protein U0035_13180 [Niabella yanshanensis]